MSASALGETAVTLWPNPSFLPKTFSYSFVNQPLRLATFDPPTGEDEERGNTALLCSVQALRAYIQTTTGFQWSESFFVCHSGSRRGQALSKQRLSRWIVEVICKAYDSSGLPIPASVRGHSTNIMGSPKGGTTVRHMCGGIMGIILHIRKILQS